MVAVGCGRIKRRLSRQLAAELELVATAEAKAMLKSTVDPNTNAELKSVVRQRPRWVEGYGRVKDVRRQSPRPSQRLMLS